MSQIDVKELNNKHWITLGLAFTLVHYIDYLWTNITYVASTDHSEVYLDFLFVTRVQLIFLVVISVVAILCAFKQFKYWRVVTLIVCLIGIYDGETIVVMKTWFGDIDSLEALVSRWTLYSKYQWFLASGFRNGIFVPLLYSMIAILVFLDWKHRKHEKSDI